ncbi:hypothetical protein [Rhodanobacter umsongensis]
MQPHNIKAAPLIGQRFHSLVSSGVLSPFEWNDENGDRQYGYELGENKEAVDYLNFLQSAIKRIAESKAPPWKEVSIGNRTRYIMSREARSLWHAIRSVELAHKAWGRESEMSPYVSVGMRLARKWEPRLRFFTNTDSELLIGEEYPRRMLAHIVFVIRRVCTSRRFLDRVEQLKRQQRENLQACCEYFLSILRVHARLLVMRADLYVEGAAKSAAGEGKIEQAVEKFIRNLREKRIIPGVLGYIIKREDAYDRGIHLHLMVIVDGDKHFKSYNLTEILTAYWIYECVGSPNLASGFNCYLRKDEYLYNAIGLVHYTDEGMLRGVREAISYLTKTDCHFLLPKTFGKNMRKGQSPRRQEDEKRRGAPRKLSNDVSLAERILLGKQEDAQ